MTAPDSPLQPGQRIGGCQVHRLIARGNIGALYGALDEASGEPRALKVMSLHEGFGAGDRDEGVRRFALEAQTAQRLAHPDIVRIHRAGDEGRLAYLVMDLLAGCDLSRYTQARRLLPEAEVMRIGERIAGALAHAHQRGVVHRDLKPANVMVDWARSSVTLTDFGVARLADAERTRTGLVLGSPAYMAPELLAGADASPASDLYALGVLLFQLLSGELPFEAGSLGDLLRAVALAPAPRLDQRRHDLPAGLSDLVDRLLAKSALARPPNAGDVAAALARLRAPTARDQSHAGSDL